MESPFVYESVNSLSKSIQYCIFKGIFDIESCL